MGWLDVLVFTLINTATCIFLPRLLAIVLKYRSQALQPLPTSVIVSESENNITRFPYCVSTAITGKQACKFYPRFCANCSSTH